MPSVTRRAARDSEDREVRVDVGAGDRTLGR